MNQKQSEILIVIPVYNEEAIINKTVITLRDFCEKNLQNYDWKIIIADNNSSDRTAEMAKKLENDDDLVIGSRFIKDSSAKRTLARKITSKVFSLLTRLMFGLKIKDYPCGFKGANKNVINKILPLVENNAFFFDTELVIRSAADGLKIKEIPVVWRDRDKTASKSRVSVLKVTKEYLRELLKLKKGLKTKNR